MTEILDLLDSIEAKINQALLTMLPERTEDGWGSLPPAVCQSSNHPR
jgi:hypothetical protein